MNVYNDGRNFSLRSTRVVSVKGNGKRSAAHRKLHPSRWFAFVGCLVAGWVIADIREAVAQTSPALGADERAKRVGEDGPSRELAIEAMHRAVSFFREYASAGGGYVYQLSDDLKRRER